MLPSPLANIGLSSGVGTVHLHGRILGELWLRLAAELLLAIGSPVLPKVQLLRVNHVFKRWFGDGAPELGLLD